MSFIINEKCQNFDTKKQVVMSWVDKTNFKRAPSQPFESDRVEGQLPFYYQEFCSLFQDELSKLVEAMRTNFSISSLWMVRYQKGDWHPPHAHGPLGYSGVVIVENNPHEQRGPMFVKDIVDPISGCTTYIGGDIGVSPGTIYYARSDMVHFTYPNPIDTPRIILSFDLKPEP